MKQKVLRIWGVLICLYISALIPLAAAKATTIELSYATFLPPEHNQTKVAIEWAEAVEQRTEGRVKFKFYYSGKLLKGAEIFDGVLKGVSDIGFGVLAYTPDRFPVMSALELPMGYPNGKIASRVAHDFASLRKPEELGHVKVLYLHAPGPPLLQTKKPVHRPTDVKGMKISAYGPGLKVISKLGGSSVSITPTDIYQAVEKGFINGSLGTMEMFMSLKMAEVYPYTTDISIVGFTNPMFVIMNKKRWDSLPTDIMQVMEELSERWVEKHGREWDRMDEEGREYAAKFGHEIILLSGDEPSMWRRAVDPIIEEYISKIPGGNQYVTLLEELMIKACPKCACPAGTYPCNNKCCKRRTY